jgi:Fic family protein
MRSDLPPNLDIESISLAKSWLDAFRPLPRDVLAELQHLFDVRLTYHSNAIEGNTLTQSETELVIDKGITIGGKSLSDHLEAIGHRDALGYVRLLSEKDEPVTERVIREIHSLVLRGQDHDDAGRFRTMDVRAAGTEHIYPSHFRLNELMAEFVAWLHAPAKGHAVVFATEAHFRFVDIHPFRDGNGRAGRLILNLLLMRAGYPIAVLKVEDRTAYIDALVLAQEGGNLDSLQLLVNRAVHSSLRDYLAVLGTATEAHAENKPFFAEMQTWLAAN